MTWVSTPRHGMVANSKHQSRHSRDQAYKASATNRRKRSRSRSSSFTRESRASANQAVNGSFERGRCRVSERNGSPQKRRRSRSGERNGHVRSIKTHHHASKTDSLSKSSSSKEDRHYNDRSNHHSNREDSFNRDDERRRGSSSMFSSPAKRNPSTPSGPGSSGSRDRSSISSSSKSHLHQHRSISHSHRNHNKPSALENRDTTKRDHASRSREKCNSSSRPFPETHHSKPHPRPETSTSNSSQSKMSKKVTSEHNGMRTHTLNSKQIVVDGNSSGRNGERPLPRHVNGIVKKRIRSGDKSAFTRATNHEPSTKRKPIKYPTEDKNYMGDRHHNDRRRVGCSNGEIANAKRNVGEKPKKLGGSSVLFPGKQILPNGTFSRLRKHFPEQHRRASSHNPRHRNTPSALENRDTAKRDGGHRNSRSIRSIPQPQHNQQQSRRDSSSSSPPPPHSTTKIVLDELNGSNTADEYDELTQAEKWVRSTPDELYYNRQADGYATATERTKTLCEKFETTLVAKSKAAREEAEQLGHQKMTELIKLENAQIAEQKRLSKLQKQQLKSKEKCCHSTGCDSAKETDSHTTGCSTAVSSCSEVKRRRHSSGDDDDSDSSSSSDSSSEDEDVCGMTRSDTANRELERRKKHPRRLHEELWHNDPGLMNDGPVCRCSAKARRFGIRHGFYPGEERIPPCDHFSNNKNRLFHYRITISPPKNFLISTPTVINHDGHEYIFEGFSIFSHYKLDLTLPPCRVIRFNIKYDVFVDEEKFPESFCVKELLLFETYLFREILELVDLKYGWNEESGCSQFHLMPRFVRQLPDNGQEVLSMSRVLIHLLKGDRELVREEDLHKLYTVEQSEWQNFADRHKGTIVTKWGVKPCAIRVDQIDRDITELEVEQEDGIPFPLIVHFGIRPPQLSYAGNAGYQRAWRRYVKYRHLLSNMPKPSSQDKAKLNQKEKILQEMRTASNMKRDVTVAISSKGFRTTGICCDLVQHAMLIPVLIAHLRFHKCLETLERCMVYPFKNRFLLQLAMTHPSYRENFGTNPDHARNALTNCGIRQPEYGDRKIHYAATRKRGINTLINIMAKFGADEETESDITHNERLEFLGDAVVEFTTSIHLFHIFPDLEEGGLATYRAAIVQNQHLAVLAQALNLDQYMLYAHGSDLCHDSELRHAMANCFEALMGALFLDGNIQAADRVFGSTLFGTDIILLNMWANYPKHPLQQEEPNGDRHWVESHEVLQKLSIFETSIGVQFNHIRLLARAFTDRSLGYNNLTKGSNQRLEFLGDTVLQLISSEYLYRHFPDHHEGHLSLLRSSIVNNRTQSLVCEDLGMPQYAMRGDPKSEMKTKDKADLLEAFLGALYIDKGLKFCISFCQICFFPRLSTSITKQEWNDPKSKLQQCCLTLRAMDGREPDIPVYKVTESLGPTNTRTYIVAVYFRGDRLATAQGHSIQEAEMNAAAVALEVSGHLFPQLHHQRKIMDKTKKSH